MFIIRTLTIALLLSTAVTASDDDPTRKSKPAHPAGHERPLEKPDVPGEVLRLVTPEYPEAALRDQIDGTVILIARVDAEGRPVRVVKTLHKGGGHDPRLILAAKRALMKSTFTPATKGGRPIPSRITVPFEFRRH